MVLNGWKTYQNLMKPFTGYFLEVDVEYPKKLSNSHKDFPFLPETQKIEKVEKLVCDINDKESFI